VTQVVTQCITRRAILAAAVPAVFAAAVNPTTKKSRPLPAVGEFQRFVDPTTESTVVRLTNPAFTSYLPAGANRFVSVKERFLVFTSDRTGRPTPFYLDLRTGVSRFLASTANLLPESVCLDAQGRSVYLIDGTDLKQVAIATRKVDVLSSGVSAFSLGSSPSELMVVRDGRLEQLNRKAGALADDVSPWCALRPGGSGCAFLRHPSFDEREFWYVPVSPETTARPLLLAKGRVSNPLWSPDGRSLMFLRQVPSNDTFVSEIHETCPETGLEQRIASTSQFAAFAVNGDGSVFVGASGSKAQPTIILLLRSVQREFTLCEHRATRPATVDPVFSPDSRRVYFESDHQGKSALYSINIESLVEPTAIAPV
jgi:oligogalacturonide lyase